MQLKRSYTGGHVHTIRQCATFAAVLLAAVVTIVPAHAQSLSQASSYSLYTTGGGANMLGTDSEGGVAANGIINGNNYFTVNKSGTSPSALVSTSNITGSFTSNGSAYATGSITSSINYNGSGTSHTGVAASSLPVNFTNTNAYLTKVNTAIYSYVGTSSSHTATISGSNLSFTATTSGANYFQIDGATLHNAGSINFSTNGLSNVSFLVNVTSVDTTYSSSTNPYSNAVFNGTAGVQVNGQQNLAGINTVLFNLNPSIVGFSANGLIGSFLAPNAAFNGEGSSAQIDGNLVVKSYDQDANAIGIEMHTAYNGNSTFYTGFVPTPATPAEESLAIGLAIGALRGIWGARRRRKRSVSQVVA